MSTAFTPLAEASTGSSDRYCNIPTPPTGISEVNNKEKKKELSSDEPLHDAQGDYETLGSPSPLELSTDTSHPVMPAVVACGSSHTGSISRRGELFTWGLASSGELGHTGWTPIELNCPTQVTNTPMFYLSYDT